MKASDIRPKTPDELKQQIEELSKEAFNLRFQRASGQLENTARVRQVRRDTLVLGPVYGLIRTRITRARRSAATFSLGSLTVGLRGLLALSSRRRHCAARAGSSAGS